MNLIQALHEVQTAFDAARSSAFSSFYLVYLNGALYCQPKKYRSVNAVSLIELSRYDLEHGLTSLQWSIINAKLRELIVEKKL